MREVAIAAAVTVRTGARPAFGSNPAHLSRAVASAARALSR
jgi:hypothetical protein